MNISLNLFQASLIALAFLFLLGISQSFFSFFNNPEVGTLISGFVRIILIAILFYYFGSELTANEFGLTKRVIPTILMAAIVGGIAIFCMPLPGFTYLPQSIIKKIVESTFNNERSLLSFINMALIVPIVEEVVFRGIILSGLLKRYSPFVAIAFSSLLFALLHIAFPFPFSFGLFMGWIYFRSRNLLYCIIVHAAVNGTAFLARILIFNKNGTMNDYIEQSNRISTKTSIPSIIIFLLVIFFLVRQFKVAGHNERVNSNISEYIK